VLTETWTEEVMKNYRLKISVVCIPYPRYRKGMAVVWYQMYRKTVSPWQKLEIHAKFGCETSWEEIQMGEKY
jgi:hypothetical protein